MDNFLGVRGIFCERVFVIRILIRTILGVRVVIRRVF